MSYKQQVKDNELLTKWRVIREVQQQKNYQTAVAKKFSMHRNTIQALLRKFDNLIPAESKHFLLTANGLTLSDLSEKLAPLKNVSRRPHAHPGVATNEQTELIKKYVKEQKMRMGHDRLYTFVTRRRQRLGTETGVEQKEAATLASLSYAQLKGICKREKFRADKVSTVTRERRALYDYAALAAFEKLHYDTKTLPDSHALPKYIYDQFRLNKELPIIEWNIIEVKTRARFMAYSHARSSEFGLHFLLLVVQYIRAHTLSVNLHITVGTDQGSEFFSGSERKQAEWNRLLATMNAEIYSYEPGFDIRKNLIERSHRSDDEEFLIPRGSFMTTKKNFLIEAQGYADYWNTYRPHSGIGMNNLTPLEKLKTCAVGQAKKLTQFPVMILEDSIGAIKASTNVIRLAADLRDFSRAHESKPPDQTWIRNWKMNVKQFSISAQNVLTYYQLWIALQKSLFSVIYTDLKTIFLFSPKANSASGKMRIAPPR